MNLEHSQNALPKSQTEQIRVVSDLLAQLRREIGKTVIGNQDAISTIMLAILCNGHVLLEGVPGVAKTTLIKAVASALSLVFKRIQFTPDLLPSDVVGTLIYNQKTQEFETKKGPIFANIVLADEINRAPAKVQSALLEAMQEQQVTLGNDTFNLPKPFFVFATQNPIEQAGTYLLPEAQLDRFMFKINMGYPNKLEERQLLIKTGLNQEVASFIDINELRQAQELINNIYVDEKIVEYIVDITQTTRETKNLSTSKLSPLIATGVSPRAALCMYQASKAQALLAGRYFVTPEDVKKVALPILRHRLILSYEAQADGIDADHVIELLLNSVSTP